MKKIERILFPTDFSDISRNAFHYTLLLADKLQAMISVVHVVYPQYEGMDLPVIAAQATQQRLEAAREVLESFVDSAVDQLVDTLEHTANIETHLEIGGPVTAIADLVRREGIDLVVMGTHGEHNAFEQFMGSLTSETILKVPCHVLAIPENARLETLRFVAFSSSLRENDPFLIWETSQLLSAFNPIFRIVHLPDGEDLDKKIQMEDFEKFFSEKAPGLQITYHTLEGEELYESLNEFADNYDIDLVVMASPHRSFFERLFHKSQTRQVALHTKTPLLIFRED